MEEGIGQGGGIPGPAHKRLYRKWAQGQWGMIITGAWSCILLRPSSLIRSGNVQVDERNLATGHDRTFPSNSPEAIAAWTELSSVIHHSDTSDAPTSLAIMQISHAGLQSSSTINFSRLPWTPAVAPVSARPDLGDTYLGWLISRIIWPVKSRAINNTEEWLKIVERFVEVACDAERAGWDGVQIHSAHGYLLAEYLSTLVCLDLGEGAIHMLISSTRQTLLLNAFQGHQMRSPLDYTFCT